MELELGHALFATPNDWGLVHRMMRTGVRMGMVDDVTVIYSPSQRSVPSPSSSEALVAGDSDAAESLLAESHALALELGQRLAQEQQRAALLSEQVADLSRRLREVLESRSWLLTAPLRRLRAKH
jgi:hypothetical protein